MLDNDAEYIQSQALRCVFRNDGRNGVSWRNEVYPSYCIHWSDFQLCTFQPLLGNCVDTAIGQAMVLRQSSFPQWLNTGIGDVDLQDDEQEQE